MLAGSSAWRTVIMNDEAGEGSISKRPKSFPRNCEVFRLRK